MAISKLFSVIVVIGMMGTPVWGMQDDTVKPTKAKAEIGKPAPDFALKSIDGKETKLSDFKGKTVVLEWTNHQCPFVKRHVGKKKTPQRIYTTYVHDDVVWLSIDSSHFCEEKIDDIRKFREEAGVRYPLLLDSKGEVGRAYGAKTTPHMFVIDRKGVLVYTGALDDDADGEKKYVQTRNYVEEAIQAVSQGSTVPMSKTKPYGCSIKYAK